MLGTLFTAAGVTSVGYVVPPTEAEAFPLAHAALFVLIRHMTADKVLREIQDAGGTVLKTSLDDAKEKVLRDALAKASMTEQPRPATPAQHFYLGGIEI